MEVGGEVGSVIFSKKIEKGLTARKKNGYHTPIVFNFFGEFCDAVFLNVDNSGIGGV